MTAIQFVDRVSGAPLGPHRTVLARAATDALAAPSIFNSQPWRWRIRDRTAELRADRTRQVPSVDAEGRLLTVSCGVALHHARTALAAAGFTPEVTYLPDPDDPDLLAVLRCGAPAAAEGETLRRYRAMTIRRTDRRPFVDAPVPADALDALARVATTYGAHVHYPRPAQLVGLTVAAGHAATQELTDPAYVAELTAWVARAADGVDGIPPETAAPPAGRPVPIRDFTAAGPEDTTIHDAVPLADGYARYAILYTAGDGPRDWLAAGEALSAVLLEATVLGLGTSPMSDLIEVPRSRLLVRDLLSGVGYPAMVVRIGVPSTGTGGPAAPRRPADSAVVVVEGEDR